MTKKIFALILAVLFCLSMSAVSASAYTQQYVYDPDYHLTDDEVYELLAGEDVYFETSYVLPALTQAQLEKMIAKHGEDKILFATDSPWQDQGEMIGIIKSYKLGKEAEDKIAEIIVEHQKDESVHIMAENGEITVSFK